MKSESLIAVALLVTAATTPAVAAANEAPLADAGLDQTVTRGTTVYLDGTGSRDPDGSIERYQWTITAESGDATNATSPQCTTCERTQFQAEATGTYRVTLEVTDDDGATTTDTLFVTVEPGTSPTASLSGPSRTTTAESAEFTVDVDAGAAPLDRLVWKQDGNRVATEPLSGTAATSSRTFNFPTTGTHDVSAVVVDDDGQRDTASKSIAVTAPASVATPSDPFGSPNDGSDANTTAPVTVLGPQVVTGGGNLTADYKLSDGATGRWLQDGEQVARGATTERRFSAGIHQLYATTDTGAATFADGSRTVVADPAPELPVLDVRNGTTPAVDLQATDDFGNIQSVTVSVDGQPVETLTSGTVQSRQTGKSLSTVEYLQNLAPGTHVVSVYARDARGQAAAAIRTVEVPGPPEVVSAGFVQDGPLDQYHPRINESRYMATYRVVVDLNGIKPENVVAWIRATNSGWKSSTVKKIQDGKMIVEKKAYMTELSDIRGQSSVYWSNNNWDQKFQSDSIKVTAAPPELRISVDLPQANEDIREGIKLDARDSFDPDGSKLDFDWYGVTGGHVEKPEAKLNPYDVAVLELTDHQKQTATDDRLLEWYAPKLGAAAHLGSGPYYPDEKVDFSVSSEVFYYSKPTYENSTSFSLRSNSGAVTNHEVRRNFHTHRFDAETYSRQHNWNVEVPASAFLPQNESPTVASYPTEHPEVSYDRKLPDPQVYRLRNVRFDDVSTEIKYRVKRPEYATRRTADTTRRDALLESGYEVTRKTRSGRKYHLERKEKIQDAKYNVQTQEFRQQGRRGFFLQENPEWEAAGSRTEWVEWTTTDRVWRSGFYGPGTYTGNTRRELVESGVYRTEKQFRTSYGSTYWSTMPRRFTHQFTGRTRQSTVREPQYDRKYEFEVERQHESQRRVYLAERRVKVQSAEYEWVEYKTVSSRARADSASLSAEIRQTGTSPAYEWTLEKQVGTEFATVRTVEPEWEVLRTSGQRNATWIREYILPDQKLRRGTHERQKDVETTFSIPQFVPRDSVKNILEDKMEEKYAE